MTTAAPVGPLGPTGRSSRRRVPGGLLRRAARGVRRVPRRPTARCAPGGTRSQRHSTGYGTRRAWRPGATSSPACCATRAPPTTRPSTATASVGPWTLDPVPLVLDPAEWTGLERAVAQRAALLDLVNADLYGDAHPGRPGPGTRRGRPRPPGVPASRVPAFAQPGAHRPVPDRRRRGPREHRRIPCGGRPVPGPLRSGLRTGQPVSPVPGLPTLHRASGVERQAGFFRAIRAGIARAVPDGVDEPRVVILTPGPLSETYFEHAYLASYLGYPLVEGRDLVVQNNRVWLRSLAGLDPVDAVIRRVDDQWCDPVELRADSLLGVPGLLEVVRRGRVAVLNPLGSGILESPALAGLLADIAPALLGRGAGPARAPRAGGAGDPTASATCWPGSTSSCSCPSNPRPAAGPCDRRCSPAPSATRCATGCAPVRATGSARRSWSPPPCPRWPTAAPLSRGRWCCGRSPWPTETADGRRPWLPPATRWAHPGGCRRRLPGHLEPG